LSLEAVIELRVALYTVVELTRMRNIGMKLFAHPRSRE
jgi:hypothetical protein